MNARDESGGAIQAVSDREILEAYRLLAQEDGVFAEPASAASVAGLLARARAGDLGRAKGRRGRPLIVVCVLTGHGLKDPERAMKSIRMPRRLAPSLSAIARAIRL